MTQQMKMQLTVFVNERWLHSTHSTQYIYTIMVKLFIRNYSSSLSVIFHKQQITTGQYTSILEVELIQHCQYYIINICQYI